MKGKLNFVKTSVIGGIIFLVPLIILIIIMEKAVGIMSALSRPLSGLIQIESFAGIAVVDLITVAIIIILCFISGLISKTAFASKIIQRIESNILKKIPFYSFVKSITESISGISSKETLKPVLLEFDDNSQLGMEVERIEGGNVFVYVPGSPNPWSGSVLIMKPERVKPLNISFAQAIKLMHDFGQGANKLLSNHWVQCNQTISKSISNEEIFLGQWPLFSQPLLNNIGGGFYYPSNINSDVKSYI